MSPAFIKLTEIKKPEKKQDEKVYINLFGGYRLSFSS